MLEINNALINASNQVRRTAHSNNSEKELDDKIAEIIRANDLLNKYCVTKAISEKLLVTERGSVPLCIARPSDVGATVSEPFPVSPLSL